MTAHKEELECRLEWAEAYASTYASCFEVFNTLIGAVGRARRISTHDEFGLRLHHQVYHPIWAGNVAIKLSEAVEYGIQTPQSHPHAAELRPAQITPRLQAYGMDKKEAQTRFVPPGAQLIDDLVMPTRLLIVGPEGSCESAVRDFSVVDGDAFIDHQSRLVSFSHYLERAFIALKDQGYDLP